MKTTDTRRVDARGEINGKAWARMFVNFDAMMSWARANGATVDAWGDVTTSR